MTVNQKQTQLNMVQFIQALFIQLQKDAMTF